MVVCACLTWLEISRVICWKIAKVILRDFIITVNAELIAICTININISIEISKHLTLVDILHFLSKYNLRISDLYR